MRMEIDNIMCTNPFPLHSLQSSYYTRKKHIIIILMLNVGREENNGR